MAALLRLKRAFSALNDAVQHRVNGSLSQNTYPRISHPYNAGYGGCRTNVDGRARFSLGV